MKFDESRVFTAVNADKVKVGSKVLVANNYAALKVQVKNFPDMFTEIRTITDIGPESCTYRFNIDGWKLNETHIFALCYLIEASDVSCLDAAKRCASIGSDLIKKEMKYTDFKVGDIIRRSNYETVILSVEYLTDTDRILIMNEDGKPKWINKEDFKFWEKVEKSTNNISSESTELTEVTRQDDTSGILESASSARNEAKETVILTNWISVKDRLPPVDTIVYLWDGNVDDNHPVLARRTNFIKELGGCLDIKNRDWLWECQDNMLNNVGDPIRYTMSRRLSENYYWKYIDLNNFTVVVEET